jgi:endonuclease G
MKILSLFGLLIVLLSINFNVKSKERLIYLDYGFFNVLYNCDKKGYEYFYYTAVKDSGELKRYSPFHIDKTLPEGCSQKSTSTYKHNTSHPYKYDRGHGNHQNVWDHDKDMMRVTNYMTNIVPQESAQNRYGLWRHTEKLTECNRDKADVFVVGGNIWGDNTENDLFVATHGVTTPDKLFKILFIDEEVYAWIIPNDDKAKESNQLDYAVSISDIEKESGLNFDFIENKYKGRVNSNYVDTPKYCSLK